MQLNGLKDVVIALLLLVTVVGSVIFGIKFLLTTSTLENTVSDTKIETQFVQYSNSANSYQARMTDYIGLCEAIGLPESVSCTATTDAYAMETILTAGGLYCIDSTGFVGVTNRSKGNQTRCPR